MEKVFVCCSEFSEPWRTLRVNLINLLMWPFQELGSYISKQLLIVWLNLCYNYSTGSKLAAILSYVWEKATSSDKNHNVISNGTIIILFSKQCWYWKICKEKNICDKINCRRLIDLFISSFSFDKIHNIQ